MKTSCAIIQVFVTVRLIGELHTDRSIVLPRLYAALQKIFSNLKPGKCMLQKKNHPFYVCFFILLSCLSSLSLYAEGIYWQTNYDSALAEAKQTKKPVLLLFTMSEGCTYCTKLKEEALDTKEFAEKAENRFVFVKLDYNAPTPELRAQHDQLQRKYNIRGYPTIIILDPKEERQIGVTGYRPGGGRQYADHLLQFITRYSTYQQKLHHIDELALQESELKELYSTAKQLHLDSGMKIIMAKGIKEKSSPFFLMESYWQLAREGKIHSKEALDLRQKLLSLDATHQKSIAFDLAIIDFETYFAQMDNHEASTEAIIAPLTAYIDEYDTIDKENTWRMRLIISQVYLEKDQLPIALRYAQECYDTAPYAVRPKLARTIENISAQIDT